MKTKLILASVASALGLALSTPALAGDRHGDRQGHRHHHQQQHYNKHWNKHQPHAYSHPRVIRERVVVHRPVYYDRYVTYAPPPPSYYPGVVVRVDIPPLVFPLR